MGGSQSKTETVYSRFPKETELLDSLKITPAVMERISTAQNAPSQEQLAHMQDVHQQQVYQQQQLTQQMHQQYEKELILQQDIYHEKFESAQKANDERIQQVQEALANQHRDELVKFGVTKKYF